MYRNRRFLTAQDRYMLHSSLVSSLEETLSLDVQDVFGWGSLVAGMMFLGVQPPEIILCPVFGRLRDRVGMRHLTWIAFAALRPGMLLLATPGDECVPLAMGKGCKAVISSVISGIFTTLLNKVGLMEGECKHLYYHPLFPFLIPCLLFWWEGFRPTTTM